jgi:hypothetical protein
MELAARGRPSVYLLQKGIRKADAMWLLFIIVLTSNIACFRNVHSKGGNELALVTYLETGRSGGIGGARSERFGPLRKRLLPLKAVFLPSWRCISREDLARNGLPMNARLTRQPYRMSRLVPTEPGDDNMTLSHSALGTQLSAHRRLRPKQTSLSRASLPPRLAQR